MSQPAVDLSPRQERAMLWCLAAVQFTHIVDFMVMMPLGPQLTALFHLSDAQFGLLVSAYSLAAGASGLTASLFVDRFERRKALTYLYAGFALATLACGLAPTYIGLMVARVLAGIFGGVLGSLVQTIVGDAIPYQRRGAAMGTVMSAFSISTVAGVPASLWLASHWGWHVPFIAIAVASLGILLGAMSFVPRLDGHVAQTGHGKSAWHALRDVITVPKHWLAFGLSGVMMIGSFSIIPYITIFTTTNLGLTADQVPLIYLFGGVATFFTSRLWGRLADTWGKVKTYRLLVLLSVVPMMALTHLTPELTQGNLPLLVAITTAFFVLVSGRMVPGMALLTATPPNHLRGGFMSVNNAIMSASMGAAAWLGGALISRSPTGQVLNYGHCGWLALASSAILLWWVGKLAETTSVPGTAAEVA
jgi:predicted MFS family arabinose efflux permease